MYLQACVAPCDAPRFHYRRAFVGYRRQSGQAARRWPSATPTKNHCPLVCASHRPCLSAALIPEGQHGMAARRVPTSVRLASQARLSRWASVMRDFPVPRGPVTWKRAVPSRRTKTFRIRVPSWMRDRLQAQRIVQAPRRSRAHCHPLTAPLASGVFDLRRPAGSPVEKP